MLFKYSNPENQRCAWPIFFRLDPILKAFALCSLLFIHTMSSSSSILHCIITQLGQLVMMRVMIKKIFRLNQWFVSTENENGIKTPIQGHLFVSCISAMSSHVFMTSSEKYGRSRESERRRNWRVSERDQSAHFNRHISLVTRHSLISLSG